MKITLTILVLALAGCAHRVKVCVISPSLGMNCTHPMSRDGASGLAEYISAYDPEAVVWLQDKKQDKAKIVSPLHPPVVPVPEAPPGPAQKQYPNAI